MRERRSYPTDLTPAAVAHSPPVLSYSKTISGLMTP